MTEMIFFCLLLGAMVGFLSGLLGIGGSILMVPALYELFLHREFAPGLAFHLALGTAMASIVFSSLASLRAHHAYGAVLWPVVLRLAPGLLLGTLSGAVLASRLPTHGLAVFFACFLLCMAGQMLFGLKPVARRTLPGWMGMSAAGFLIGSLMSLIAGGGGALSVPFLVWCNVGLAQAIGTSAALGFPIALGGTLGYLLSAPAATELPVGAFGYVYLPALLTLVPASLVLVPFGVRTAHRLPLPVLRRIFAAMLLLISLRMFWKLLV